MWEPQWAALTAERDVVRLDLRGFGDSVQAPAGPLSPVTDVAETLAWLGIERCHVVGASYGAGVAVELALTRPELVASLLLAAPGGALIAEATPDLRAFFETERAAVDVHDFAAAVEANLVAWVDGPLRAPGEVASDVRDRVRVMQRRAFDVTATWGEVAETEIDPPALSRLGGVRARTLVLAGALDLDAIAATAKLVTDGVPGARLVEWPDVAHLPSMERPDDFTTLVRDWISEG